MKFIIEHLSKRFEEKVVLKDINFTFEKEKFMDCLEETEQAKQHFSIASTKI